jgi:hypothetical protein
MKMDCARSLADISTDTLHFSWWKISKKLWIKERENVSLLAPGPVEKVRHPNEWRASRLGVARNSQSRTKSQRKWNEWPLWGVWSAILYSFIILQICQFSTFGEGDTTKSESKVQSICSVADSMDCKYCRPEIIVDRSASN